VLGRSWCKPIQLVSLAKVGEPCVISFDLTMDNTYGNHIFNDTTRLRVKLLRLLHLKTDMGILTEEGMSTSSG